MIATSTSRADTRSSRLLSPRMTCRAVRQLRSHAGLLVLLLLGLGLRVALSVSYRPAMLSNTDTWAYVKGAAEHFFVLEARRPAGYSMFLRGLHEVSSSI